MKKSVYLLFVLMLLPFVAMAQSTDDDMYYVPSKKKAKTSSATKAGVVLEKTYTPTKSNPDVEASSSSASTNVVVRDSQGNARDVDEYNRRYTSRDNTFSVDGDTLYIEEKPENERGEWVNGFQGDSDDYEYAMRIVRFRSPRYGVPISSPLYWDLVYSVPSWEWNVFNDGLYAYVIPTRSNFFYWDWYHDVTFGFNWGWYSPWHYNSWGWHSSWYYDSWAWGHPWHYWGVGYPYHPFYSYHSYWRPYYHSNPSWHGWYGSSALNSGKHTGRYVNSYTGRRNTAGSGGRSVGNHRTVSRNGSARTVSRGEGSGRSGRVVSGTPNSRTSLRTTNTGSMRSADGTRREVGGSDGGTTMRSATGNRSAVSSSQSGRSANTYTRPSSGQGSNYTRPSSTRSYSRNSGSGTSYQRSGGAAERNSYAPSGSSRSSSRSSSGGSSSSSRSVSSGSSFSGGGGSMRSASGGSSRSVGSSSGSSSGGGRHR